MLREIKLNDVIYEYDLQVKDVKNINLRVRPDQSISVSAGSNVSIDEIEKFMLRKKDFIIKNIDVFSSVEDRGIKNYISGESFLILGKQLRLKVVKSKEEKAYIDGEYIYVCVKNVENTARKRNLVNKLLKEKRNIVFEEVLKEMYKPFKKYGVQYPRIAVRQMKTRWGSCLPQKELVTLNSFLLEVPKSCIEYVIVHELTHFLHKNHNKEFHKFMTMIMPDYKERKQCLENIYCK